MGVNEVSKDLKKIKFGVDQINKPTPKIVKWIRAISQAVSKTLIGSGLATGNDAIAWVGFGAGIINETIGYMFGE